MMQKKRTAGIVLSAVLAAGSMTSAVWAAETFSGSAQGMESLVTVELTMEDGTITDVAVDVSGETQGIGAAIGDEVAAQILEAQNGEIDGVAGATVTSGAVKEAVEAALAQATGEGGAEDAELAFTPGTYTGASTGYNGPVEISVTFDEKSITDIEVVTSAETDHVGTPAYDILIPQIIEANGTGVDGVSGATFTARALKEAVNAAAE